MIYLDSAATSLQKPRSVHMAVQNAMRTMASPGRGGHRPQCWPPTAPMSAAPSWRDFSM